MQLADDDLELVPGDASDDYADPGAEDAAGGMTDEARAALIRALSLELQAEFTKRKSDRRPIEQRWIEDIAQYNAQYTGATLAGIESRPYGSKVFVPLTRRICNVVEAKTGDLLFPTDDRNFAVQASPEPDLSEAEAMAKQLGPDVPVQVSGGMTLPADAVRSALREIREENAGKANAMQRAIDDQLKESRYAGEGRKAIHNAIKLGTGIIKGPFVLGRVKKRWLRANGAMALQRIESWAPAASNVDPWNYYPDLTVGDVEDMNGHFEVHPLNKAKLARLAKQPGFDEGAIRRILSASFDAATDSANDAAQRDAAGTSGVTRESYSLVEYNGPVDHDKLVAYGVPMPEDSLLVYMAVVWFHAGSGEVVKAILNPMDTEEQPYCVFNWQRDTACVLGYGVPYELRDTQEAGNSTFRAMLDNMGLSVGGQTVINDQKVIPANGSWAMEPNKVWRLKDASQQVQNVFGFYQVNSLATELLAIFNTIKTVAEEIGGPALAMQGSEAPSFMQAGATGAALAFNAANVWMRRAVRNWDDQVTVPMVGRFIDWNMQYNPDDGIKGDLQAMARGTSALLEADGYAGRIQVLMQMSAQAGIPVRKIVNQLRKVAVALRLDPDEVLPDDAEVKTMEDAQQKSGPPPNPEMERIKQRMADIEDRKAQRDHEVIMQDKETQIRLAEIASRDNSDVATARLRYGFEAKRESAKLQHESDKQDRHTQEFNAEIAARYQTGAGI